MSESKFELITSNQQFKNNKLTRVISELQAHMDRIPEEHQSSACLDITYDEYDGYDFEIYYFRPKTNKEKEEEELTNIKTRNALKNRELKMLTELKAKYEGVRNENN